MEKVNINTYEDFIKHTHKLPLEVLMDVDKRISDWLATGGTPDDSYIKQQYRYCQNIINIGFK